MAAVRLWITLVIVAAVTAILFVLPWRAIAAESDSVLPRNAWVVIVGVAVAVAMRFLVRFLRKVFA
jgi:hypothetical protein